MSSCKIYYTPQQQTTFTIEKLPAKNSNSICKLVFKNHVVWPIYIDWKQHSIDKVKVPYFSQWQYKITSPHKLVKVGHLKIQLGLIDTNIPKSSRRNPTHLPSNLEITQITEAAQCYPIVAKTLAYINLLHLNHVDQLLL